MTRVPISLFLSPPSPTSSLPRTPGPWNRDRGVSAFPGPATQVSYAQKGLLALVWPGFLPNPKLLEHPICTMDVDPSLRTALVSLAARSVFNAFARHSTPAPRRSRMLLRTPFRHTGRGGRARTPVAIPSSVHLSTIVRDRSDPAIGREEEGPGLHYAPLIVRKGCKSLPCCEFTLQW